MDLSKYLVEMKGNNLMRGVVNSIMVLALGVVALGFFFQVGDTLALTGESSTYYNKIKTIGFSVLYLTIIVPIALVVAAVSAIV